MTVLLVAAGGAVGAVLRYVVDRLVQRRVPAFPYGTLTVNVIGSAVLGLLTGLALAGPSASAIHAAVGIGLCGSLTTYSTFGYETVQLFTERARLHAVLNVVATVAAGFAAAGLGLLAARAF